MTIMRRQARSISHAWLSLPALLAMGCMGAKGDAPLMSSSHPLGLPTPGDVITIDFKNDSLGNPLSRGEVLGEQYAAQGIHFQNGFVLGDLATDFPQYQGARPDNVVCAYSGGPQGSGLPCAGGVSDPNVPLVVTFDYPICFASLAGETLAFKGDLSPGRETMIGFDASGQLKGAGTSRDIYNLFDPTNLRDVIGQGVGIAVIPSSFGGMGDPRPIPSPGLDVRSLSITAMHLGAFDNLVFVRCSNVIARCSGQRVCQPAGQCSATVPASVDGGSQALNGAPISLSQSPAGPYPLGSTLVTLTATDGSDLGICTAFVSVIDCTPPVITCPPPQTVECKALASCAAPEGIQPATVTDDCSQVTASGSFGCLQQGDNPVTYSAPWSSATEDTFVTCNATLTVRDTLPPDVSGARTTPLELWPPDGQMKTVTLQDCGISLNDLCAGPLNVADYARITRVTADEGGGPMSGNDRGCAQGRRAPPSPDIAIVGTNAVELRATRSPRGDGRLYTISYEVHDATGNSRSGSCQVSVPIQQGGASASDSGVRQTACPPPPSYELTYLSDGEGDVNAINDRGQVVGSNQAGLPVRWDNGRETVLLPASPDQFLATATALNNDGHVVGYTYLNSGENVPFLWANGRVRPLPGLTNAIPRGINDHDQIVGSLTDPQGAFLYDHGHVTVLTANGTWLSASDINNGGQIVGTILDQGIAKAMIWKNGTYTVLPGLGGNNDAAYAINEVGQVVGSSAIADGTLHAVLWDHGAVVDLRLDESRGGPTGASATAINDRGVIVGYSFPNGNEDATEAFVYADGYAQRLTYLTDQYPFIQTWLYGVNNANQAVGIGYVRIPLGPRQVMWSPERGALAR